MHFKIPFVFSLESVKITVDNVNTFVLYTSTAIVSLIWDLFTQHHIIFNFRFPANR